MARKFSPSKKAKVSDDFVDAALALVDQSMIDWDEEDGVAENTVVAAVQKLKGKYAKFFESKLNGNSDIKDPASRENGGNKDSSKVPAAPKEQAVYFKNKYGLPT